MKYITKLQEAAADEYIGMTDEEDEETSLEPKADKEIEFVDLHTVNLTSHPTAPEHQFKALSVSHHSHKGGSSEKRNGERTPPKQGKSPTFKQIRMRESYDLDEAVEVSHDRYMRSHGKKAKDSGFSTDWMFTHKQYGTPSKDEMMTHRGSFKDAKKAAQKWAAEKGKYSVYVMESVDLDEAANRYLHSNYDKLMNEEKTDRAGAPLTLSGAHKKAVDQAVSLITSKEGNKKKNYADWEAKTTFGPVLKKIVKSRVGLGESFINEALKPGSFTLKSGETVKLSESDASALNSVLASLSVSNKKKMEEELTRDKRSFSKIIQFARKAVE